MVQNQNIMLTLPLSILSEDYELPATVLELQEHIDISFEQLENIARPQRRDMINKINELIEECNERRGFKSYHFVK